MQPRNLLNRVEILERKMDGLEGLPDRVASLEGQIVQFREETRAEFSAFRTEMRDMRAEMRGMHAELVASISETRTHMGVLYEDAISRIAIMGEGSSRGHAPADGSPASPASGRGRKRKK